MHNILSTSRCTKAIQLPCQQGGAFHQVHLHRYIPDIRYDRYDELQLNNINSVFH